MNTATIPNRKATDNSVKVIGYGHSTTDCIVKLCLDTAGGNLAQAQGLVQRYVTGKAAQQKIIRAIGLHVNPTWVYDDGGRATAGFQGKAGDCVVRAVTIVSGLAYGEVYDRLAAGTGAQRATTRAGKQPASARRGIHVRRKWFQDYMRELGFVWTPTMQIGSGCKVHLRADELPSGRLVVSLSKHYVAVIDGVIHDNHDCSRSGTRCVYGYWRRPQT